MAAAAISPGAWLALPFHLASAATSLLTAPFQRQPAAAAQGAHGDDLQAATYTMRCFEGFIEPYDHGTRAVRVVLSHPDALVLPMDDDSAAAMGEAGGSPAGGEPFASTLAIHTAMTGWQSFLFHSFFTAATLIVTAVGCCCGCLGTTCCVAGRFALVSGGRRPGGETVRQRGDGDGGGLGLMDWRGTPALGFGIPFPLPPW